MKTFTLYHPRKPAEAEGSAFAIHFTPKGDEVEIVNHVKGGMGIRTLESFFD